MDETKTKLGTKGQMNERLNILQGSGVAIGAAVILAFGPLAQADEGKAAEKEWEITVGFDFYSEYVFRGVDILANEPLYSPSASITWKGFSLWYWGGFGNSPGPDNTYEENDYGADYTLTLLEEKLSITGGVLMYHYPDSISGTDTYEVYGIVGYDTLLQPSVSVYYDFDEVGGAYLTFGIGHTFDLTEKVGLKEPMSWTIDPSAALSIDIKYNDDDTDFNDLLLGIGTTLQVTEYMELHAGFQLSIAMANLHDIGQDHERIGNVGLSFSF